MKKTPVVELENIHLSLTSQAGAVNILRGVDLTLYRGETTSIMGRSGSGKTSLLMVVSGLQPVTRGQVKVAQLDITHLSEDALARFRREHIGIVFQSFHLIPTMSALENVAVPLEFAAQREAFKKAEEALAKVGLAHRLHHFPAQLSGGEQQRVAIARAFVTEPSLLLADEPTGNLDETTSASIINLLFDLQKQQGVTLLLVTHDAALAKRCKRIIRLEDGVIAK